MPAPTSLAPDDAWLEASFLSAPAPALLDRAAALAPSLSVERQLVWSQRLRQSGRERDCPLLATALCPDRTAAERALAAASAWLLARDDRAAEVVRWAADRLAVFDRMTVQQLVPDLVAALPGYYLHARPEILSLIPPGATDILEVGCAAGALAATVKARQRCRYAGVELDPLAARIASNTLDEVRVVDLDTEPLGFGAQQFDCVIAADVLEHLKDPWGHLQQLQAVLRPGGFLVASIPNIRNLGVLAQIAGGEWAYEDAGILDRTHLRFFTLRSFGRALAGAGFTARTTQAVLDPSLQAAITADGPARRADLGSLHLSGLSEQDATELATIQFLVVADVPAAAVEVGERPSATVVIPAWNAWAQTEACLAHLRATLRDGDRVVVVDNGSVDATAAGLRSHEWIEVVTNPANRGFPAACNQGAAVGTSEVIVFLNNDTVPVGAWLDELAAPLRADAAIGAVGARSNFVSGTQLVAEPSYTHAGTAEHIGFEAAWRREHSGRTSRTDRLVGFCLAVRRSAFEQVGGFDEAFGLGGYDDDDLCRRLQGAGWTLVVAHGAYVHHVGHQTFDANGVDWAAIEASNRTVFEAKAAGVPAPPPT